MAPTKVATKKSKGFTDDEKAAMRERARELKAEATRADGEKELLTAISKMEEPARSMAKKLHALIGATAPALAPKTWYGMPAYANDGNVVCFFKNAGKFKTRYSTLGFSDKANLGAGNMWPTEFALTKWTPADAAKITALIKKAVR